MSEQSAVSGKNRDIGVLELVRESLVAVVKEMRANIIHSSYSSIIYEGHDFSCALVSADGRLLAQSLDDNPLHIFAVPHSAREIIRVFGGDIREGDVFLHNDPYTGGTHLNDVLMLYPVFSENKLVLFAAARCHWGDVGGSTPGSLSGRVTEILQEGIRIVPTRISEKGKLNEAFLELLFQNMRNPAERKGDFKTMLGTSRKAAEHVKRLITRFGAEKMLSSIDELMHRSEQVMRERIKACPDGVYYAEGYIESNGNDHEPIVARLKLTIDGDRMIADFTGTAPQTKGPTNVGPSMAPNAVCTIAKAFLDPKTSINHGSFEPIEVIAPVGSFINARWPAPCGGMVEVKALLDSLMVAALGQAMPEMISGALKGGANHTLIGGNDPKWGSFLFYEYPAGGTGASKDLDGGTVVRAFSDGDFNSVQSIEVVESSLPLRIESYGIRENSCGDGKNRGGFGMRRCIRVLSDSASLSILSDRNVIPPYGVMGGMYGEPNHFVVKRGDSLVQPSAHPGKVAGFPLNDGDIVMVETSGGGGYGDPLERDIEKVRRDVSLGYLGAGEALRRYGVAITPDGNVDAQATQKKREEIRSSRVFLSLQLVNAELLEGFRRIVELPRAAAARLSVADGALIEIVTREHASPRAWVRVVDGGGDVLRVDAATLALVAGEVGDRVEVRPVRTAH
ncbi:MAG: hydantoinase B/oxoprolinase family protein [Xanthobacteraceae bacterium]|nr:hydantoinase B/oxoprolinase family protein [Xanthobacteraceae bacterium]